ncbi:MAG: DUF4232 domain-containing protein [Acidimicrobiales bacterium]
MHPIWRMAEGGLGVAITAVTLSACSSTPPAHHETTTTRPPAPTTSSVPTTSTTSTASSSACQTSDLRVVDVGQGGAAGTQEVSFSLTSTSSTPCVTYGYPGLLLLSTSGAALPTTVIRGGALHFEDIAPARVTLHSGETAYFNVGFNDVQSSTGTCSVAHHVEVTPPTATAHATVQVEPDIDACGNGTLNVSAVFAETDGGATQTTAPPSA